jgi:eukaryotic-like serine/threonine-protein kinase
MNSEEAGSDSESVDVPQEVMDLLADILGLELSAQPEALDRVCADHPEFAVPAREIFSMTKRMMKSFGNYGDALRARRAAPTLTGSRTVTVKPRSSDGVPARIGPYKILEPLGEGGMGVVYLGEQREPVRRRVAIKVIKRGMDSKKVLARFEAERQVLAMMEHSSIARIYECGESETGQPYFAMEYIKGRPITRYCDDNHLDIAARLGLFLQVCSGVQHAHNKGVIHRDLTPNNVLITVQDSDPRIKIIDFGLARATDHRLTEATILTEQGQIIGTPDYMSPEQAGLEDLDIDTRTDVYTLGVLLYELIVGLRPFDFRRIGLHDIQRVIREDDPRKPSTRVSKVTKESEGLARARRTDSQTLTRRLRGDLDWIAMRALEKDRTRRYVTPTEMASDIERHLRHEPVLAGPPGVSYRLSKLFRRYRLQAVAAALLVLSLTAGVIGTTWFMFDARKQETAAEAAATTAERE